MNVPKYFTTGALSLLISFTLYGQNPENCFLEDFELKTAEIPLSESAEKPTDPATVTVTVQDDTLGKVSKYVFGNAIAAWAGAHNHPLLIDGIKKLAPTLIRMPGGSWSNGYFFNGIPFDVPDSIYDGTTYNSSNGTAKKNKFGGLSGIDGGITTPDQYYTLRENTDVSEGLITVNYAYARYGTGDDPVARAAHLAADWVRYDNGRTRFWEIGNENGGPWEYGWMIDTSLNKDGQPQIINGEIYGKHFRVFVDSMKAAAAEIGHTIYIGGQVVIDGPTSWNFVDRDWNEKFFKEVGDYADFYIVHNYFSASTKAQEILDYAETEIKRDWLFLEDDFTEFSAFPKPITLTEYNIGLGSQYGHTFINGMQATILICEMLKNNYGMAARWLLSSGEDGMFSGGSNINYLHHPRPDFYYLTYLQKYFGDHVISTNSSNSNVLCYASKFSSGETAVIIVNKGTSEQTVNVDMSTIGVGEKYYIYSFKGGTDNGEFSENVYINGYGPGLFQWGPYSLLYDIPADAYTIENEIKFTSPGRSIQMILIEDGDKIVSAIDESNTQTPFSYKLNQNYPNPFNPSTRISYQLAENVFVTLKIYDVMGREIETLVSEQQNAGNHSVQFSAAKLPSGVYFYKINAGTYHNTRKLLLVK